MSDESNGIGEENVSQLQDRPQEAGGARDLQGSAAQAAPGVVGVFIVVN
jgi:hypothetical protein